MTRTGSSQREGMREKESLATVQEAGCLRPREGACLGACSGLGLCTSLWTSRRVMPVHDSFSKRCLDRKCFAMQ